VDVRETVDVYPHFEISIEHTPHENTECTVHAVCLKRSHRESDHLILGATDIVLHRLQKPFTFTSQFKPKKSSWCLSSRCHTCNHNETSTQQTAHKTSLDAGVTYWTSVSHQPVSENVQRWRKKCWCMQPIGNTKKEILHVDIGTFVRSLRHSDSEYLSRKTSRWSDTYHRCFRIPELLNYWLSKSTKKMSWSRTGAESYLQLY